MENTNDIQVDNEENQLEKVKKENRYKVYPTYTSSINKMDTFLDPRLVLGIIQGNTDLKKLSDVSYTHRMNILKNIDDILKDEVEHIDFPQVSYYFSEQHKANPELAFSLEQLNSQYSSHMTNKVEKIKNKSKPMPSPGDSSLSPKQKEELENKRKHEISHKQSLSSKMTPFKIPNPMK